MKRIETVALIGLGAMGSAYLAEIAEAVPMDNIKVIASGDRARRYSREGVSVNGRTIRFPIAGPEEESKPADLVIFTVKYGALPQAIKDARNHVGPDTTILSLLNGIKSESVIAETYGWERLLYSLSMGSDLVRTESSTVYTTLGYIPFGEAKNTQGAYSERVLLVEDLFKRVGLKYDIPEDMIRVLWKKFMMNTGVSQIITLLRCGYGAVQKAESVRALAISTMEEVVAVAEKEGVNLTLDDIVDGLKVTDTLSPAGKPSTLQDVEAMRPTEVDIFAGTVIELAKKHNLPVPVNEMLYRLIKAMEEAYPYSIYK